METQYGRVWFGVCRQSVQLEAVLCVLNALKQCLKLVTLEWDGPAIISILDESRCS